jgi:hypothetical protein
MRAKKSRLPRPKKARSLLAVAGGAALMASIVVSAVGCEPDVPSSSTPDLSRHVIDFGNLIDMRRPGD